MINIDQRLAALYDEYCTAGKEEDFIEMLYEILDMATEEIRVTVVKRRRSMKAKEKREANKKIRMKFEAYLNSMTPEERIAFLNTPWDEQPEWVKTVFDGVRFPEEFNFLRIAGIVDENERQHETCGARIIRYMESHGLITSDENGTKLHYDNFSRICNELAEKFDLPRRPGHKAQRTRVTPLDLYGYTTKNITPKKDKLTVISAATGIPVAYFGGYMDNEPPASGPSPDGFNPFGPITNKFRKKRSKGDAA